MTTLVDTSALIGYLDRSDVQHSRAVETFQRVADEGVMVVHNYVIVETAAIVHRRYDAKTSRALFDDLLPALQTVWVDEDLHRSAVAAYRASITRSVSLVDHVSFEVMRTFGIEEAFAFDRDFTRQGFRTVP